MAETCTTKLAIASDDKSAEAAQRVPSGSQGSTDALVRTRSGELRGRFENNVYAFTGVRYGENTSSTRFRPATAVMPWKGIRDACGFGDQCLQPATLDYELLRSNWNQSTASSEDCLFLNIWTPAINDATHRPVMVYLHGGGWTIGNGNSAARSGARFAKHHDVVRVNINHRLGIFGFTYLAGHMDPEYADAGNLGMLDIILALHWVQHNISGFGGDPSNVTIFGVSGGGAKVSTLMAMPAAKGLFHRAAIESGPKLTALLPSQAAKATEAFLKALDISSDRAGDILNLSGDELLRGFMKMYPDGGLTSAVIGPVLDERSLPRHPFEPDAPEVSSDIPLMIGTTLTEMSLFLAAEDLSIFEATWADLPQRLPNLLPGMLSLRMTDIDRLKALRPEATPAELLFAIATEKFYRGRSIRQAERASKRPAPVFMWLIEWVTPVDGGKWGSPHGLSVPLILETVQDVPSMFGPNLHDALELSRKMSAAWAAFARTGAPAIDELPLWPPYDLKKRQTMVFDNTCHVVCDPHGDLRRLFE